METPSALRFEWNPNELRCEVVFQGGFLSDFDMFNHKLAAIPDAEWQPPVPPSEDEGRWRGCLVCSADNTQAAILAAKSILRPELPVTITRLDFHIRCCGALNQVHHPGRTWRVTPTYMPGMQPDTPLVHQPQLHEVLNTARLQDHIVPPTEDPQHSKQRKGENYLKVLFAHRLAIHLQHVVFKPQYCCV